MNEGLVEVFMLVVGLEKGSGLRVVARVVLGEDLEQRREVVHWVA